MYPQIEAGARIEIAKRGQGARLANHDDVLDAVNAPGRTIGALDFGAVVLRDASAEGVGDARDTRLGAAGGALLERAGIVGVAAYRIEEQDGVHVSSNSANLASKACSEGRDL